jgi:hypothetical protein
LLGGGQRWEKANVEPFALEPYTEVRTHLFVVVWAALVVILVAAPGIYNRALRLPGGEPALPVLGFLAATSTFLVVLVIFPRSACHRGR